VSGAPTDRFRRVDTVFDAVIDLPSGEQTAFLDRVCGDDEQLRQEVLDLLRAYQHSDFLDSPAVQIAAPILDAASAIAGPAPDRIGPFRVVREIGRGGMGRVFLGERADGEFEQRVALKLIQHGAPGVVRRFVEERRILAMLEHPAIARLVDGGITTGGLPYFAMELVEGEPIDRYCEVNALTLDRRLDLFAAVCDAVSYAHQHLIIHRDLKPSNILVRGDGQVKLLDFGIAKLLGAQVEDSTRTEARVMTPEFAAPEQVRGGPISTATDVYSLGVLLYVLLTGERPYEVRGKSPAEIERVVCDEPPTRPSSKAPEPSRRRLRGDLDLIVMTALQKQPERRYQSPAALAQDLQRFRQGRAILARPDSARYRLGKFLSRNRTAVAVATATGVALVAATAFSVVQMRDANAQRQEAVRAAQRAAAMSELQIVLAGDSRDPDGRPLSPAGRIALAERVVVQRFQADPALVAGVIVDLSERYFEAGDTRAQLAMLGRARSIALKANAMNELALADCARAKSYWIEDRLDSARADVLEAKAAIAKAGRSSSEVDAICLEAEAKLLQATGRADSGIALLKRAVALGENEAASAQQISLTNSLAEVLRQTGRTREAVPYFQRMLASLEAMGYGETEMVPNVVSYLATSFVDLGELAALDSTLQRVIRDRESAHGKGRVPPSIAFLYARGKLRLGEMDSADAWLARAARDTTQGTGQFQHYLASTLAELRLEQGRLVEARVAVDQLRGQNRAQRATAAMLRARLRRAEGDARGASELLEQELRALSSDGQPSATWFALPLIVAGEWRLAAGDARGADSLAQAARTAAAIDSAALQRSAFAGRAELLRARALRARGEMSGAREAADRAVAALTTGYGAGNAWTRAARVLVDSLAK
jgi:eukaryotic-like serine/threonine-protein kinase